MNNADLSTKMTNIIENISFGNTFIVDSMTNNEYSYEKFFSLALLIASQLQEQKIQKLILILDNSSFLCIMYFACMLSGTAIIPLDPQKSDHELHIIIEENKESPVVIDSERQNLNIFNPIEKIDVVSVIDQIKTNLDIQTKQSIINRFHELDYNKEYLITYTSGTSGKPKGVRHSLKNLLLSAFAFADRFHFQASHCFAHVMPMTYMAGILNTMIMPFVCKSKIVLFNRFSVKTAISFWNKVEKYEINTFWLSPTMLQLILQVDRADRGQSYLKAHETIFCIGTAPLNESLKSDFEKHYCVNLYQSYGLSETLFLTTETAKDSLSTMSVGKFLDGVEIRISDDNEIQIKVPWMFLGYTNENTEKCFYKGYYCTGDLGQLQENGILKILGRKKDLIIKGGINIQPTSIENELMKCAEIEDVLVFSLTDNKSHEEIIACAYIPLQKTDLRNLERIMQQQLIETCGKLYQIDRFFPVKQIPYNANGKKDRIEMRERIKNHDY